jgi:NAD(P)-dependent dehydrogenase (short-subunit alcohol dehydrogenase family)
MVPLEVGDEASVRSAVQDVLAAHGRLDVLVNNAGRALLGAAEETSDAELAAQLMVNLVGVTRITRAVLPVMREQRYGRIVTISSLGGLAALPQTAAYAASKFAVEGYSESLRHEVLPFDIHVSVVEPPNLRTGSLDRSISRVDAPLAAYGEGERLAAAFRAAGEDSRHTPQDVARVVARIVASRHPRLRYPIGAQARALPILKALLPQAVFEAAIRRRTGLPVPGATLGAARAGRAPRPRGRVHRSTDTRPTA